MSDATPYTVPKEPGRWRAVTLAALVHAALLAFLWIGVRWQNETPTTIEAEVWSPQPREAAPPPEPVKEAEPQPVVKETPPPIVKETPVVKTPAIVLEQEKKRKEQEKKRQEEELAKQEQLAKQKKAEQERLAKLKKEQDERQAKLDAEKAKKAAEAKRKQEDEKLLAEARAQEMRRITGGVTGTGGSGEAPKSQGGRSDSGYAGRVAAKIKSNIVFNVPEGMVDNPPVEYVVDLLPDGSVAGMRKTKSSGVPGFDEAVRRAIEKSQPYPKDKSGSVPSSFIGIHRPKDQ